MKTSSVLSSTNDALKQPLVASRVVDDATTSDDNKVRSSFDASCDCSAAVTVAVAKPSHTVHVT